MNAVLERGEGEVAAKPVSELAGVGCPIHLSEQMGLVGVQECRLVPESGNSATYAAHHTTASNRSEEPDTSSSMMKRVPGLSSHCRDDEGLSAAHMS